MAAIHVGLKGVRESEGINERTIVSEAKFPERVRQKTKSSQI